MYRGTMIPDAYAGDAQLGPDAMRSVAADLVRAVRGRRSQAAFSRHIGYSSNIAHRWESGACWPTAAVFLRICARLKPERTEAFARFLKRAPGWLDPNDPFSDASVAAFLRELQGNTPLGLLAERSGHTRFSVSRWLRGGARPKLPEFLCLVEAASRRGLDFIAQLVDPKGMATISPSWIRLERARRAAHEVPWSHAVMRALELAAYRSRAGRSERWLAAELGIDVEEVRRGLAALEASGQIRKSRGKWRVDRVISLDTRLDPVADGKLKAAWTQVALERLQQDTPGHYGYSLFAISRDGLRRMRELHLQYVRAMQSLIASSTPAECVGLYCAQLIHLSAHANVFDEATTGEHGRDDGGARPLPG